MVTMSKKERDQRQTLATMLQHFVDLGVLTVLAILHHIKLSRARGLAQIATLHTFEKIVGDLLELWPGEKKDTLVLMSQAKLGGIEDGDKLIIEKILERIPDEELAKLVERWMSADADASHRLTYEQIAHAFSPAELSACVRYAMKMVDILEDAPDAEVVDEVVVEGGSELPGEMPGPPDPDAEAIDARRGNPDAEPPADTGRRGRSHG